MMRPWAKWCCNHRLRWALYAVAVICLPLYIFVNIDFKGMAKDLKADLRRIKGEGK
jgi:hypothetical protein